MTRFFSGVSMSILIRSYWVVVQLIQRIVTCSPRLGPISASVPLKMEPLEPRHLLAGDVLGDLALIVDDSTISENGGRTMATVSRGVDTARPLTVRLASSDTGELIVPSRVIIPAGETTSRPFAIEAVDDEIVDGTQTVTLSAEATSLQVDTYSDDFSAAEIDPFWTITNEIPGASVTQADGKLTITSPTPPNAFLDTGLQSSQLYFDSDFIASVRFRVPEGNALPWLALFGDAEETPQTHVYGLYLHQVSTYRVWQDNNVTVGNTLVGSAYGDERFNWHEMRIEYDADTNVATSFLDDLPLNQFELNLDQAVVRIFMKDSLEFGDDGTSVVEFDDFEFSYRAPFGRATAKVDVTDDEVASLSLSIADDSIRENGEATTATVSRNSPTTEPLTVSLSSSDVGEAVVPETVTIAAGENSVSFPVTPVDDSDFDEIQRVTITASATDHEQAAGVISVEDDEVRRLTLTVSPSSISENGGTAIATVSRNTGSDGDLVVRLESSDASELQFPPSVVIPDGQHSTSFAISAVDDDLVDGLQTVEITAVAAQPTFSDDFSGGDIDPFWNVEIENPFAAVTQAEGVLKISSDKGTNEFLDSGLESAVTFGASNFIAAVDFRVPLGNAMPWISLAEDAEETESTRLYGLYLHELSGYRVWRDNNETVGNAFVANAFGDEAEAWHRLRIEYDADAKLMSAYIDGVKQNEFPVGLDRAVVRIFMKDHQVFSNGGASAIEFDNFEFSYGPPYEAGSAVVEVSDNDVASLMIEPDAGSTLTVSEAGASATLAVRLTSQPFERVVVGVGVSDSTEAAVSTEQLIFTAENWDVPQQVEVTGLGDMLADGDVGFTVQFEIDGQQSDSAYAGVAAARAGVNTDVPLSRLAVQIDGDRVLVLNVDTGVVVSEMPLGSVEIDLGGGEITLDLSSLIGFDGVVKVHQQNDDTLVFGNGWTVDLPQLIDNVFTHVIKAGDATLRLINERPFQNPFDRFDTDMSGHVSALDALVGINYLGRIDASTGESAIGGIEDFRFYYDVNGDDQVSAVDALQTINHLGRIVAAEAELFASNRWSPPAIAASDEEREDDRLWRPDRQGLQSLETAASRSDSFRTDPSHQPAVRVDVAVPQDSGSMISGSEVDRALEDWLRAEESFLIR